MNLASGRVLLIVESEGTARAWAPHVRPGDRLIATGGHVLQLAQLAAPGGWSGRGASGRGWPPSRAPIPGQSAVLQRLRRSAAEVDAVAIATDPDREGERIALDVAEVLRPETPRARILLPAPSEAGLLAALRSPRELDPRRADAALVRALFDAILVERLRRPLGGQPVGRVQAAALGALVEGAAASLAAPSFVGVAVAGLTALRLGADGAPEPFDEATAAALAAQAPRRLVVRTLERVTEAPPNPLTTAALLATAGAELGLPVERVLERLVQLARGLELDGRTVRLVTYPRTDAAGDHDGSGHGALEPLPGAPSPEELRGRIEEGARRVYARVWDASRAREEPGSRVVVTLEDGSARYRAEGHVAEKQLQRLAPGRSLPAGKGEVIRSAPAPTEGALVRRLEALGVGRPSTLAAAVGSLQRRGLATRRRGELSPTPRGSALHDRLRRIHPALLGPTVTARLEEVLEAIETGACPPGEALSGPLAALLPPSEGKASRAAVGASCARCGRPLSPTRPAAEPRAAGSRRFPCWNCMHLP